jgi:hypothetical protein
VIVERDNGQIEAAASKFLEVVGKRHWGRPSLERVTA